ncbi:transporter [Ganoderma sinense ZZ0214-1]|uniref:Transporter n=1 Tax=Ganoderma sinense ZZ0214-1 TaxID=1077348 RepID=A0A2G8S4P9_9APHY|nr:transporter [Ganoderma sinense ZZ0214-1]
MFHALGNYFHERRRGLTKVAGYVGGAYMIGRYVSERLDDVRNSILQERAARENLRRRFEQNQQDISFTVMALLPTLGTHILEGMDVEGVTQELQSYSKAPKTRMELQHPTAPSESSLTSSVDNVRNQEPDVRSENGSVSVISSVDAIPTEMSTSSTSWVDQFSSQGSSQVFPAPREGGASSSPRSSLGGTLSDSVLSTGSASGSSGLGPSTSPARRLDVLSPGTRSKAELWREVKILTFTRTLTVIYSMTLLSLFTHIQLNILGRSKYIQSMIQQERDERVREQLQYSTSVYALFWGDKSLEDAETDELEDSETVREETERKFLTLSWWILHVGWKDVGERVRRGVEEVFESVSLKTKLSAADLHRLICDVRRRVEYEVTFEGKERRINFMSTLLPPTPETLQHVLTQGGIPAWLATVHDPTFDAFLSETRTHVASDSFELVLEVCLDRATDVLFRGVEKHIFGSYHEQEDTILAGQEPRERLAAMLPGLARWCHLALEGLPNELVDGLADAREVSALSAIIYSSYEDRFR